MVFIRGVLPTAVPMRLVACTLSLGLGRVTCGLVPTLGGTIVRGATLGGQDVPSVLRGSYSEL